MIQPPISGPNDNYRLEESAIPSARAIKVVSLASNAGLVCPGVRLSAWEFLVAPEGVGRLATAPRERLLHRYIMGSDVTGETREQYVFDAFTHDELRDHDPEFRVKQEREQNMREKYRREWWIHAEPRRRFRPALTGPRRLRHVAEGAQSARS